MEDHAKDEKLVSLREKLSRYELKLSEIQKLKLGKSVDIEKLNSLEHKIRRAVKITEDLISKRLEELEENKRRIIEETIYYEGDYVFAKKPGFVAWYVSVVEKVIKNVTPCMNEYVVKFVGENPAVSSIVSPNCRTIIPYNLPRDKLRAGYDVLAVWDKDQKYYKGVIDKLDDIGWVWIRFKGYSGVQKTRIEHIRLEGSAGKEIYGEEENKEKDISQIIGKKRKRKEDKDSKISKKRKLDEVLAKKKKSWNDFLNKGSKKKLKGFSKRKSSIHSKFGESVLLSEGISDDRNRKRKGAVMQRRERKNTIAENVLEEMDHLKKFEGSARKSGGSNKVKNSGTYDRSRTGRRNYGRHDREDYSYRDDGRRDYGRNDFDDRDRKSGSTRYNYGRDYGYGDDERRGYDRSNRRNDDDSYRRY